MIKRSLAVTGILFALYSISVLFVKDRPWFFPVEHQWQENLMTAQEYIYERQDSRIVIVGSSMSRMIEQESLPADCFNLSLIGRSLYEGLVIIRRAGARPDIVLAKTNVTLRDLDGRFINGLFNPVLSVVRKRFPPLRAAYSPIRLLQGSLRVSRTILARKFPRVSRPASNSPDPGFQKVSPKIAKPDTKPVNRESVREMLTGPPAGSKNESPDSGEMQARLGELKREIDCLIKEGANVVFFEMPVHPQLYASARAVAERAAFRRTFPPSEYTYLRDPECERYHTTDTVHLDSDAARNYFSELMDEMADLQVHLD